jgi:hypothetical protein
LAEIPGKSLERPNHHMKQVRRIIPDCDDEDGDGHEDDARQ